MGLEPTTNGTTNRYSNQLSYNHRIGAANIIFEKGISIPIKLKISKIINLLFCKRLRVMKDKQLLLLQIYNILRQGSLIIISVLLAKSLVPTQLIAEFEASMLLSVSFSFFAVAALSHCLYPLIAGTEETRKNTLYFHNFLVYTFTGIIAAFCIIGFSFVLTPELNRTSVYLTALYTLFHTASFFAEHFLIIEKKSKLVIVWGLGSFGMQIAAVSIPLVLWNNLNLALGCLMVVSFARFSVNAILILTRTAFLRVQRQILWQILQLSGPVMLSLLSSGGFVYIIQYLVHAQSTPLEFALFRYGTREFPLFAILTNAFSSIYSSRLASGDQKLPDLRRLSHQVFIPAIALMLLSPFLFRWFLNHELAPAWIYFNVLLLGVPAKLVFPQSVLLAFGQTHKMLYASIIEGFGGLIIAVFAMSYFGLIGAVIALVCAYILEKIVLIFYCRKSGLAMNQYMHFESLLIYSLLLSGSFVIAWHLG